MSDTSGEHMSTGVGRPPWEIREKAETRSDLQVLNVDYPTKPIPVVTGGPRHRKTGGLRVPSWWPLALVLVVQAGLSLRLVWSNTAFQDEALYLWAGHLEWNNWLHGASIHATALPTYFSGAPVAYPPLGALADSIGGLAGARLLSLLFMLGATGFLYSVTTRLYGHRPALFACVLFATAGPTQFLGAFATYDAMALFLLSLAVWLAVRAMSVSTDRAVALLIFSALVLAAADVTKYAATLFDPAVIAVAMLIALETRGWRFALASGAVMCASLGTALAVGLVEGGATYWHGITETTLTRSAGNTPAPGVLFISGKWVGMIVLLAVIGSTVVASRRWPGRWAGIAFAAATFLAPIEQAHIHTLTSLFKHVGYGSWFGAVVGGCALAALASAVPRHKAAAATRVAAVVALIASVIGIGYAGAHFSVWPNTTKYVAALRSVMATKTGTFILVDDAQIPEYYLRIDTGFDRISNTSYFAYTEPGTRMRITQPAEAYAAAIKDGYFTVISLTYGNAPTIYDAGIVADISKYGGYRLVSSIPYTTSTNVGHFLTWVREGAK